MKTQLPPSEHQRAESEVGEPLTNDEALCVLDALSDDDDPNDALEEFRFWRSPRGREIDAEDFAEQWPR